MTGNDAVEFLMAGAKCISVGSANLVNPNASIEIIEGIEDYMKRHGIQDVNDIVNSVIMN